MKFDILTFKRSNYDNLENNFVAVCYSVPGANSPFRSYGNTREEAQRKTTALIQEYLDKAFRELIVNRVELTPSWLLCDCSPPVNDEEIADRDKARFQAALADRK